MVSRHLLTAVTAIFLTAATAEYGEMAGPGLSPRYHFGEAAHLVNRQTGVCPEDNQHTCNHSSISTMETKLAK